MIQKFTVSRDDSIYQAWPDVALHASTGRLICVFSECTHHGDRSYTRIMVTTSDNHGRSWTPKRPVTNALHKASVDDPHWNCPRITALHDGRLAVVIDKVAGTREGNVPFALQSNWLYYSSDAGETWHGPHATPVIGIVPDKLLELRRGPHAGRWFLSAHRYEKAPPEQGGTENWMQQLWHSDDKGASWHGPVRIAASTKLKLCEGSILECPGGELVCFLRENSFIGLDGFKSISRDGGMTWSEVTAMPMPGCHRPVAGLLNNGRVLITHRYLPGGKAGWGAWTQNTFATLTDVAGCLAESRNDVETRVLPLDFDRSPNADTGYTGWVQFDDGEIYVVNYILDDAPQAQIRGYSLRMKDFLLD
ncbi:hypothetical protein DB346_09525 [Verrucomicrobia bacterium LW23]|nr:hypothetical protein DB346_09525 [Verrucomicrobia bacterium LW23]